MINPKKLANQKSRIELRTQMDFKGINIETKLKLKIMAANRGVPLYQLLDEIVEQAFKKEKHTPARPGISGKIRKEVRKLLKAQVRAPGSLCQ